MFRRLAAAYHVGHAAQELAEGKGALKHCFRHVRAIGQGVLQTVPASLLASVSDLDKHIITCLIVQFRIA